MNTFLIDQKIISLFLGLPEDDVQVFNLLVEYNKKVFEILTNLSNNFYSQAGWTSEQIKAELDRLQNDPFSEEDNKLFMDERFVQQFDEKVNEYNRLIYKMYKDRVSPEQEAEIENYISLKQQTIDEAAMVDQYMLDQVLDKLLEEHNKNGKILSAEEAKINNPS